MFSPYAAAPTYTAAPYAAPAVDYGVAGYGGYGGYGAYGGYEAFGPYGGAPTVAPDFFGAPGAPFPGPPGVAVEPATAAVGGVGQDVVQEGVTFNPGPPTAYTRPVAPQPAEVTQYNRYVHPFPKKRSRLPMKNRGFGLFDSWRGDPTPEKLNPLSYD